MLLPGHIHVAPQDWLRREMPVKSIESWAERDQQIAEVWRIDDGFIQTVVDYYGFL